MDFTNGLFKNTSWLTFSQITTNILAFLWTILIANYLNVGEFGIINAAISFMSIFSIFMDLGMSIYATRDVSRDKNLVGKYLSNMLPLKIVLSGFLLFLIYIFLMIMDYSFLSISVFLIFGFQFVLLSVVSLFNGIFQGLSLMKYQSIGSILNSVFILVFTVICIYLKIGLICVPVTYTLAAIIYLIYSFKSIKKIVKISFNFDLKFWVKIIRKSFPFGLTNFFTTIYFLIDTVMLSLISGDFATGIYSSAYKIIFVFTALYSTYTFVIFPLMSKLYKNRNDLLKITYEKSIKYLLVISIPICVGISFYSSDIIALIFKSSYTLSGDVLKILVWILPILFINGASTQLLNSSNYEKAVTKINLIACIFAIIINYVLISKFSYVGASISVLLTVLLIFILSQYIVSKNIFKLEFSLFKNIFKILFSSLTLLFILYLINISLWIAIPFSIIYYSLIIFLLKVFDKGDIHIFKEILGRN